MAGNKEGAKKTTAKRPAGYYKQLSEKGHAAKRAAAERASAAEHDAQRLPEIERAYLHLQRAHDRLMSSRDFWREEAEDKTELNKSLSSWATFGIVVGCILFGLGIFGFIWMIGKALHVV